LLQYLPPLNIAPVIAVVKLIKPYKRFFPAVHDNLKAMVDDNV